MKHTEQQVEAGAEIFRALVDARDFEQASRMFENLCTALESDWTVREIYALRDAVVERFREQDGPRGYGV